MQCLIHRRLLTGCLAALHLLVSVAAVVPAAGWAQVIDGEPPLVDFQPVAEGIIGDSQVFTATVTDDVGVTAVVLHFRFDTDELYETREMRALGNTDIYTTTLQASDVLESAQTIQYYIEASDDAGNRTLQGFAFDPIERTLVERQIVEPAAQTATESDATPAAGMSTSRKVLYGLLGVIVVGALASSSSGGGGGQPGVDVTVIVEPLP